MIFHHTLLLTLVPGLLVPVFNHSAVAGTFPDKEAPHVVLQYVTSLAQSNVQQWAMLDLGCLARAHHVNGKSDLGLQQACWNETMKAHRSVTEQTGDSGVFGSVNLEGNFGLLHERHRVAATWRDYPPAVFASPAVVRAQDGPAPGIRILGTTETQPVPLVRLLVDKTVTLSGVGVDVVLSYPDPFTAPLALSPDEPSWAKGITRKYRPVREVTARFIVVSGLRQQGFPVDVAVLNEALTDAPGIPYAHYGMNPDPGRLWVHPGSDIEHPPVIGGLRPKSVKWWTAVETGERFRQALANIKTLPAGQARERLVSRLRTLAPLDSDLNSVIGDLHYDDFLAQGDAKSGLKTEDKETRSRSLELFWTLQAQTWRQELTAVSNEYEPAAAALYGAIGAYENLLREGAAEMEQRRRLGALYRWNNDSHSALQTHEHLLNDLEWTSPEYGRVLTEIAWDKIQWVSWNRMYDHPWLTQALDHAQKAEAASQSTGDKLLASYAHLVAEALRVPRNGAAVEQQLRIVKSWHNQTARIEGLWALLVGNDVVKSMLTEGATVSLPVPLRSDEVVDVRVHAQPPKQDLFRRWDFDKDPPGKAPEGFSASTTGTNPVGKWTVTEDRSALSLPNVLEPTGTCVADPCFHFVTTSLTGYAYPDVTAQALFSDETPSRGAGVVLGAEGSSTLYFVMLNPGETKVRFYRIQDGEVTLLATETVRLGTEPWHSLRAQRVNFLHINRPTLAAYIDGFMVSITPEDIIPPIDRYGLVVQGTTKVKFDSLHVLDLVTNRPMSKPAAY